jgi:hypothetical protein
MAPSDDLLAPAPPAGGGPLTHSRAGRLHVPWPAFVLLGWLLYEFTSQPGLAAAVTCAKFGWADLCTAAWLRRVDPDRRRGQTCFWFYLAFGMWKVALTATALMIGLLLLSACFRQPVAGKGLARVVGGTLLAGTLAFGLTFLTTYVAVGSALCNGVKVWLGSAPHRARTARFWPPCEGHLNAGPLVAVTTLVMTMWVVLMASVGFFLVWRPPGWSGFFLLLLVIGATLPVGLEVFRFLDGRVFARSPQECWDAAPDEMIEEVASGQ